MTDKQKRFCEEYLVDCNAKQAAIRAGYSARTAYSIGDENLKKPELRAYIKERMDAMEEEASASAKEVVEYLTSVMRGEEKNRVLRSVGGGEQEVIEIDVPAKDRIRAAELIGKRYGLFRDNVDINGSGAITIVDDL